eukprot:2035780-Pleurochrysis_carterae.AAC.1
MVVACPQRKAVLLKRWRDIETPAAQGRPSLASSCGRSSGHSRSSGGSSAAAQSGGSWRSTVSSLNSHQRA